MATIDKELQFAQTTREITMPQETICGQEVFVADPLSTQAVDIREVAINLEEEVLHKDPPVTEMAGLGAVDLRTTCHQRALEEHQYGARDLEVKEVNNRRKRWLSFGQTSKKRGTHTLPTDLDTLRQDRTAQAARIGPQEVPVLKIRRESRLNFGKISKKWDTRMQQIVLGPIVLDVFGKTRRSKSPE